jgi:segregation and condensation protein B
MPETLVSELTESSAEEPARVEPGPEPRADARPDPQRELPFPEPSAEELPALVEAVLFVSDGPVDEAALARALGVPRRALNAGLDTLAEAVRRRGVRLQRGPEGAQLVTAPEAAAVVEHYLGLETGRRLSTAALETLAVVAYRQPVTRATIEAVRGVNSDASIATLRARDLIAEAGRTEGPGRPAIFVTTQRFLQHFGLERPEQLPGLHELLPAVEAATERTPAGPIAIEGPRSEYDDGTTAEHDHGEAPQSDAAGGA